MMKWLARVGDASWPDPEVRSVERWRNLRVEYPIFKGQVAQSDSNRTRAIAIPAEPPPVFAVTSVLHRVCYGFPCDSAPCEPHLEQLR